ncbi:MAG TPA: CPBP family glutamic-type intramembrane protease [Acidobacteriaceae bacterium]|nr:CPBP family glutamic-type intramembrane protease [Acidobacteriaceae bacterium]
MLWIAVNRTFSPRARDLLELAVGYGLILVVIWTRNPEQRLLYWVAFAWIAITTLLRRRETESFGLGLRGLPASLWIVGAALLLATSAVLVARRLGTLHPLYGPVRVVAHILEYALWALMQQFILQIYVLGRLFRVGLPRAAAVALATLLFAIAHLPNPVLVPLTLVWGVISCMLFLRYRNLYGLALAHGILGMCLAVTVPNDVMHHMRVGRGYQLYEKHPRPFRLQFPVIP